MNAHQRYVDWLPLYVAGQLDGKERAELDHHLVTCPTCRAELDLWRVIGAEVAATSSEVSAPAGLASRAHARIQAPSSFRRAFLHTVGLLRAQAYLVRSEMWPSAAILMVIGVVATLLVERVILIRYFAPLIAAASLAIIFGPDHDPAYELTLATPTSPWKVLLARLALVHGYNLVLTLVASLVLLVVISPEMLGTLIIGWLGPMTFLPALALLLSLWTGSSDSVAVVYGLWLLQFISPGWLPASLANFLTPVVEVYRQFWARPALLIAVGFLLLVAALWSAGRVAPRMVHNSA